MEVCQRTIVDKDWTGHSKRKCHRPAVAALPGGLQVCAIHWKRWKAKMEKRSRRRESSS